jgi:hypothetical protein
VRARIEPFTQAWVDSLKHIPEIAMVASITVSRPGTGTRTYDADTDTWTTTPDTVIYSGKARVQPIRSDVAKERPGDTTKVMAIRFSIPAGSINTDIFYKDEVRVTSSPLNTTLLDYVYYVTDPLDSSNPIEKTFHAEVDLEARP